MPGKRRWNGRRLSRKEVAALIESGATRRPDLEAQWSDAGIGLAVHLYSVGADQTLQVFDTPYSPGLRGKGHLLTRDDHEKFVAWAVRVRNDARAGRLSSVSHWHFHSKLREAVPNHVDALLTDLAGLVGATAGLEMSYAGLDVASRYIDTIGFERASHEIYDHLVAYAGEVMRRRARGEWRIRRESDTSYPWIAAPDHAEINPVNAAWGVLTGLGQIDLRSGAANEVRRARGKYSPWVAVPADPEP